MVQIASQGSGQGERELTKIGVSGWEQEARRSSQGLEYVLWSLPQTGWYSKGHMSGHSVWQGPSEDFSRERSFWQDSRSRMHSLVKVTPLFAHTGEGVSLHSCLHPIRDGGK